MSKLRAGFVVASLCVCAAAASAQTPQDATIVDPDAHKIALDNEHVRVLQAMASPGWKSPMHSHPPLLLVSLGTARVRMTYPDGKKELFDLRPGSIFWINGVVHS